MSFYNFNQEEMRRPQPPGPGDRLRRDGANIADVLATLEQDRPEVIGKVKEYLSRIVPGFLDAKRRTIAGFETLQFRYQASESQEWTFPATGMSDGTLRALAVIVALFQQTPGSPADPRILGIEEPELALHPAAAGLLLEALNDASRARQVLVTSHSPDLLDNKRITEDQVIAVIAQDGAARLGNLDELGATALREHLSTPGELLRQSMLIPERTGPEEEFFPPLPI